MGYSYGNLAYELEREEAELHKKKNKKKEYQAKVKAYKIRHIKVMMIVVMTSLVAYFMVAKYVAVDDTQNKIESLEKQISEVQAQTSQKTFELEQSVDLATIEEHATTRLGMHRPEKYQTIYVNVRKDDKTEITANQVEGIRNRMSNSYIKLRDNVASIFTIK